MRTEAANQYHHKSRLTVTVLLLGCYLFTIELVPGTSAVAKNTPLPIRLYVSVSDRDGNPIETLEASDFQIFEKKKLQNIAHFQFQKKFAPFSWGFDRYQWEHGG